MSCNQFLSGKVTRRVDLYIRVPEPLDNQVADCNLTKLDMTTDASEVHGTPTAAHTTIRHISYEYIHDP